MTNVDDMRDHWWWRPGWRQGRSFYTWHITFEGSEEMRALVGHYAPLLDRFPALDQVGISGLHLTVQGIGFTDEVQDQDVEQIVEATRNRLAAITSFSVQIGPAQLDPETVQMPVQSLEQLSSARLAIRDAIADVWGPDNVPEQREGFRPHVTLAYSSSTGPSHEINHGLREFPSLSARVNVGKISLIDLNRDARRYEWVEVAAIPLGG